MPPTNCIVEGGLVSRADIASVQHREVMDALRLIQAGQKDLDSRLGRVEYVLLETKESLKPKYASDISNLFQNLLRNDCSSGSSQAINQDSRDAALLQNSSSAPDPPIRRTRDIKDQMVEEEQERRERMHEAVDQIEDSSDSLACPVCNNTIKKSCFLDNHFDWCTSHEYITPDDLDDHDSKTCLQEDAGDGFGCCIVHCDYGKDEWEEEERTAWFNEQMARGSP